MFARRLRVASIICVISVAAAPAWARSGKLEVSVVDRVTGKPLACRMHLRDGKGRPRRVPDTIQWDDHFVFDGKVLLKLPLGRYTFEIECGPEYLRRTGHFQIDTSADDTKVVDMKRFIDMSRYGWWSGDLDVRRHPRDMRLLMRAENLHVAHLITWNNKKNAWHSERSIPKGLVQLERNRCYHQLGGNDARTGGSLLMLGATKPIGLTTLGAEFPPTTRFAQSAREDEAHLDVAQPYAWDLPVWVANQVVHSVQIANPHMRRRSMVVNETGGMSRDRVLMPAPMGVARWGQDIYFHLLNCGLKLPPTAGSGSGVAPNPVGYNRVYVHCGEEFGYKAWMEGLAAGRVVVSNGPLLRPSVEGRLPGHVFTADKGKSLELEIGLNLSTQDKVEYLEVIKNGEVVHEVPLRDWANNKGQLPPLKFKRSGWFLVRAVTTADKTYRFAMTGPYYVEIGYKKRVSKKSAQFFLDWVYKRAKQIKLPDAAKKKAVLAKHRVARDFFQELVSKANAP